MIDCASTYTEDGTTYTCNGHEDTEDEYHGATMWPDFGYALWSSDQANNPEVPVPR